MRDNINFMKKVQIIDEINGRSALSNEELNSLGINDLRAELRQIRASFHNLPKKQYFTEQEIIEIPTPAATETHFPVSHGVVINTIQKAISDAGFGIIDKKYSVTNGGNNIFAFYRTDYVSYEGMNFSIGFRNSHSKQMSLGLCSGLHIIICSNMVFKGEFITFKKHTQQLDNLELVQVMASETLKQIEVQTFSFTEKFNSLREFAIDDKMFKELTFESLKRDIVKPSRFNEFLECCEEEKKLYGQNLFSFHGGCTRLFRNYSLFQQEMRNVRLNTLIDDYLELAA